SAVKRVIADGSVGLPHVRVGHRQALNTKRRVIRKDGPFFIFSFSDLLEYGPCVPRGHRQQKRVAR
ncbi:hypothetical protein, partial [Marinobacterium stanieri]|uniref:hypothetical protein n=1 Tax=Marinobacterium stanieri TaxID=49186 RepID=UPI003A93F251